MVSWEHLTSKEEILDIAENISFSSACVIFKHSTSCSISSVAYRRLQEFKPSDKIKVYYLDLLQNRDVSNFIADYFGVQHESPQVIVIQNGTATYNNSHLGIDSKELESKLHVG